MFSLIPVGVEILKSKNRDLGVSEILAGKIPSLIEQQLVTILGVCIFVKTNIFIVTSHWNGRDEGFKDLKDLLFQSN